MGDIQTSSLIEILPLSIATDDDVKAAAEAFNIELQAVSGELEEALIYARIDELGSDVLDHLAYNLKVDFYEASASLEARRNIIKQAFDWHRIKGTRAAVERIVSLFFDEATVREWFEYGGDKFKFKINTEYATFKNDSDFQDFFRLIAVAKNVRSWLEVMRFKQPTYNNLFFGGVISKADFLTIGIGFSIKTESLSLFNGGVVGIGNYIEVLPPVLERDIVLPFQPKFFGGVQYLVNNLTIGAA